MVSASRSLSIERVTGKLRSTSTWKRRDERRSSAEAPCLPWNSTLRMRTVPFTSLAESLQLVGLLVGHLLHLALYHLALERTHVVDQQLVNQVIVLVLHRARVQPLALGDEL